MATKVSFRVLLSAFSLALAFILLVAPQSQIISLTVGVDDIGGIAYVARRVVMRWEWEEAHASGPVVGNGRFADAMTGRKGAFLPGYVTHETIRKTVILSLSTLTMYILASLYYCYTTKIH
jgi:hypothetical protein